jgi:hypothetical protein
MSRSQPIAAAPHRPAVPYTRTERIRRSCLLAGKTAGDRNAQAVALLCAEGLIDISPNRTRRVTGVSQKNALELIDVMGVLACAGVEWGVPNLTETDLAQMRQQLDELLGSLRSADVATAASAIVNFSAIMISVSGNAGRALIRFHRWHRWRGRTLRTVRPVRCFSYGFRPRCLRLRR